MNCRVIACISSVRDGQAGNGEEGHLALLRDIPHSISSCQDWTDGPRIKRDSSSGRHLLTGAGTSQKIFASTVEAFEQDERVLPLSPLEPSLRDLATGACRGLEKDCRSYLVLIKAVLSAVQPRTGSAIVSCCELTQSENSLHALNPGMAATPILPSGLRRRNLRVKKRRNRSRRWSVLPPSVRGKASNARLRQRAARLQRQLGRYMVCLDQGTDERRPPASAALSEQGFAQPNHIF